MFDFSVVTFGLPILIGGLFNTILFCTISIVLGLVVGSLIAIGRVSGGSWVRVPAQVFVEIMRNTPLLVQAFLVYFALPQIGLRLSATAAGILVLSLFAAANFSEAIRSGILSVPKGQMEAARAVGMPYFVMMRRIVFAQMLGFVIPALTNQIIGVIKESAALSVITVPEVAMAAQVVVGESFGPIEAYLMVAVLYWLLTGVVAFGMGILERHVTAFRSPPGSGRNTGKTTISLAESHS